MSQLPVSGVLDPATLRQMARPRCGVADTDGQAAWTERVSALFAGRRAKMRRKRFAKQGEHSENVVRVGSPATLKPWGLNTSSASDWAWSVTASPGRGRGGGQREPSDWRPCL